MSIITVQEYWHCSHEQFVQRILKSRRQLALMPVGVDEETKAFARVDGGRWLVDCPFCTGAELADKADPRFYCLSCLNAKTDHRWLRVTFPEEMTAIEEALLERPEHLQFWRPGVTLGDLQIENIVAAGDKP